MKDYLNYALFQGEDFPVSVEKSFFFLEMLDKIITCNRVAIAV